MKNLLRSLPCPWFSAREVEDVAAFWMGCLLQGDLSALRLPMRTQNKADGCSNAGLAAYMDAVAMRFYDVF